MRRRKEVTVVSLPEEIIESILSRLPVKSIGQFRCVSKQWYNLLSHPQFIKAHLNLHTHKQQEEEEEEKVIFSSHSHALRTITFNHNPQNGIIEAISRNLNSQKDKWYYVKCSCDGLVLVEDVKNVLLLINPTTSEYHTIPKFHLALPRPSSCRMYGLGYDFVSDDYKVVTLSRYRNTGPNDRTYVDVYSTRMGVWRRLERSLPNNVPRTGYSGVLVNGVLHWLSEQASDFSRYILAFDLSDEKFLEMPVPHLTVFDLGTLRGCLSGFSSPLGSEIDVWMMREYPVEESWTKFSVVVRDIWFDLTPLILLRDDVVLHGDEKFIVYNMKEGKQGDMMVDGVMAKAFGGDRTFVEGQRRRDTMDDGVTKAFGGVKTFVESLVSPTFGRGTRGYFIA